MRKKTESFVESTYKGASFWLGKKGHENSNCLISNERKRVLNPAEKVKFQLKIDLKYKLYKFKLLRKVFD